jgi:hypothetical protein
VTNDYDGRSRFFDLSVAKAAHRPPVFRRVKPSRFLGSPIDQKGPGVFPLANDFHEMGAVNIVNIRVSGRESNEINDDNRVHGFALERVARGVLMPRRWLA